MLVHEYETIYISRPDLGEESQKEAHDKIVSYIGENGGEVLVEEKWGRRKLAYPIQKLTHANYVLLDYVGPADLPAKVERLIRLDDRFIRFLTVLLDENVEVDNVKEAAETRHKRRLDKLNQ